MRISRASVLSLLVLFCAIAVAVPSPASIAENALISTSRETGSWWKRVSNRLIDSIWGFEETPEDALQKRPAPPLAVTRYGGDVVIRFNVSTVEETRSLAEAADTLLLDVWEFSQDWVDIRLGKDIVPNLLGLLPASLQHKHAPLLGDRDLAHAISNTYTGAQRQALTQPTTAVSHLRTKPLTSQVDERRPDDFFSDYQPLRVIEPWMRLLAELFKTHARLISVGTSYEGREILALRVGVHPTNNQDPDPPKRKTILITGGVHAREWIGTSTVNYLAYSLITSYGKIPTVTTLLEAFDFVFVPTLNPDGYLYTWTTDRLWRKNRQRTNVRFCQGIDLDRGYGFEWDAVTTAGNPCSENFAGDSPFEAVESQQFAEWAKNETENNNVDFIAFLDLHSYSQQILYPYSYSCQDTPPGQENLEELAVGLEKAIRMSSGLTYEVLAACEGNVAVNQKNGKKTLLPQMEAQGGSALDWFYHEMHVRYAYQMKLRDRGSYGFLLPKENIIPTGKEVLGAVMYLAQFLQGETLVDLDMMEEGEKDVEDDFKDTHNFGNVKSGIEWREDDAEDDGWVMVDDLIEGELLEELQWELKRRRKR